LSTQTFFQIGEVVPLLERSKNVGEIFSCLKAKKLLKKKVEKHGKDITRIGENEPSVSYNICINMFKRA
jgi:methyl coenzyme M reductase beta subunit